MITLALLTIFVWMCSWFIVSLIVKRNDVVDFAWGLGFVLLAWVLYINRPSLQFSIAVFLVSIWGIRLSVHIFLRNCHKTEDYRYQQWRQQWGKWATARSFFQIFMLQGILLLLVAAPLLSMGDGGLDSISVMSYAGVVIWSIGFFFEAVGDYELTQFMKDPKNKGKIM